MLITVNYQSIEVEEFENSFVIALHIRQNGMESGEIDESRQNELSKISTSLSLAYTTTYG
jgi:hypothetical protein